ncbi:Retrotransposon gag domain [Sesbania bispinosa]|nr:Retrotransposon gag domain [Sesbania bispinosa]
MAEATRHQVVVREAEERIMAAVNPRFEAMEHRMDDLQELVGGLGMQISELGFFALDDTPEGNKVTLASIAMDEVSYQWFQGLERSFSGRITWRLLVDAMKVRFGAVYEDPMEELVQLRQTGSLSEYQEAFDGLVCKVDLNETQKLSCYVAGLKPEIAVGNRGNQLPGAGSGKWNGSKIPSFWAPQDRKTEGSGRKEEMAAKISTNSNNQKGILGKPNLKVQQRLSAKELDEHRKKGLCYFCHEKFGPGQYCPQRKKMHVFLMETEEEGEVITEEDVIEEKEDSDEGENLVVSMNAIHGETRYPTLRITGWLGKRRIHILVDTGSNHNFVDPSLLKEGIGSVRKIKPVCVTAANGGQIPADKELLALVHAVRKWHQYLAIQPFTILTDQQSLKHLLEQHLSTPAQYTWVTKLMGLTYDIKYKKGRENVATYALSRASHGQILQMSVSTVSMELWQEIQVAYAADATMHQLKQQIINDPDAHPKYKIAEGVVLRKNRVVIPKNEGLRDII